jgi:cysteine desulfurase
MNRVYLDHISSCPLDSEVLQAMLPFLKENFGNPGALHQEGLYAREAISHARKQVANLINAKSDSEIIFTSSGTEANNLALKGAALALKNHGNHIIVSAIEHPSVLNSAEFLESLGFEITKIPVNKFGLIDPEDIRKAITPKTILVATHLVNHDIGAIQPIKEISNITTECGISLFVDATACVGWLNIDVQQLAIDYLSISFHRFYGPKGVGALYKNRHARLRSLIHGGFQEFGLRAGVENVPAIVGAGKAAELASAKLNMRQEHTRKLQAYLWEELKTNIPYIQLNGPEIGSQRITTNLNVSPEFIEGEGQLLRLDLMGFAVASGSSCVTKNLKSSPVLKAMGVDPGLAQGSIIVTIGEENTLEQMASFVQAYTKTVAQLRSMSPLWDEFQKGKIKSAIAQN